MPLNKETNHFNECPVYDNKPSDDEASVLELQEMWYIPSLALLPGPYWPQMVVPVRVSFTGQIEQESYVW